MVLATISAQRFVLPTKDPVTPLTKAIQFLCEAIIEGTVGQTLSPAANPRRTENLHRF
jgi:hypothetical protein